MQSLFENDPTETTKDPPKPRRSRKAKVKSAEPAKHPRSKSSAPTAPPAATEPPPAEPSSPKRRRKRMTATEAAASVEDLVVSASPSPLNGPLPAMPEPFLKVTEIVLTVEDPVGEFKRLWDELRISDALTPAAVQAAANEVETRAMEAHQLYLVAKEAHGNFETQMAPVIAALRDDATSELQADKDQGLRNKSITDADVVGRVAHKFPDEWCEINNRKVRAKALLAQLERLADIWKSRSRSVSAMLHSSN